MKLKSRKIIALVLTFVMIFSAVPTSFATVGSDMYDSLYTNISNLFGANKAVNAAKAILVATMLEDNGALQSKVSTNLNASTLKDTLEGTYKFTSTNINAVVSEMRASIPTSLSDTSLDAKMFLDMYNDPNLASRYTHYEPELETLRDSIYGALPQEFRAVISAEDFQVVLNAIIDEKIGSWNASYTGANTRSLSLSASTKTLIKNELTTLGVSNPTELADVTFELANIILTSIDDVVKTDSAVYTQMYELLKVSGFITYTYTSAPSTGGGSGSTTTPDPVVDEEVEGSNDEVNDAIPEDGEELTDDEKDAVADLVDDLLDQVGDSLEDSDNPEEIIGLVNETMEAVVGALEGDEAADAVSDFVDLVEDALENPNLTPKEAEEMVVEVLSGTLDTLLEKDDLSAEDKLDVKERAADLMESVIKSAGTVEVKTSSTEGSTVAFEIDEDTIADAIGNALAAKESMADSLAGTGLASVANNVEVNVNIELPEVAEDEKVSLELDGDAIAALGENGMGLTVEAKGVSFKLPASLMAAAKSGLTIESNPVSDEDRANLNTNTQSGTATELKTLDLSVNDGTESIKGQVELTFSLADLVDVDLDTLMVAVFEDGKWVKLDYEIIDGNVVFTAPHFSIFSLMSFEPLFEDINNSWAKKYISSLTARGLVSGKSDVSFDPNGVITRAEFVTILVNYLNLDDEITVNFKDVETGTWYYEYVARAGYNGLSSGASEGNFYPNVDITRQDMAVMIAQAFNLKNGYVLDGTSEMFADDDSILMTAKTAVYAARANGIISGYSDNTFGPLKSATRAEAATMIYKLLEK